MLKRSGKCGEPFLFLVQVRKLQSLAIRMLLAVGVSQMPFIRLETLFCTPSVLGVFYHEMM